MGNITIVTPPATKDLTILATFKTELGVTGTDLDVYLQTCITQASVVVSAYCERDFIAQRVKETVKGYGTLNLVVSITPVTTIHAIKYGENPSSLTTVDSSEYALESVNAGFIRSLTGGWRHSAAQSFGAVSTPRAGSEISYYEVEYTGGYTSLTTLPYDIERAALDIAKSIYFARKTDPNIASESVPDVYSVQYKQQQAGLYSNPYYNALLAKYKRRYL